MCYPAQAVAVVKVKQLFIVLHAGLSHRPHYFQSLTLLLCLSAKVTGKKVYAAGQWSKTAVSSLLTPKPQEPVAKETAASQPQVTDHIELLNRFIMIIIHVCNQLVVSMGP